MSPGSLTPDTSLAIMQAAQGTTASTSKNLLDAKQMAKIDDAAKEFEAMFASEMIKPMFDGISTDGKFGGGQGEKVFRGLLVDQYGKLVAKNGGLGLSGPIREQMIKMQEEANNAKK